MENVSDALKMAGAAMLFVIAFSVTMFMVGKARETADAVLTNLQLNKFVSKIEPLDTNVTREVGIETVIPSIYRYCQSDDNIMVRILDEHGNELQVFDQEIEGIIVSGTDSPDPSYPDFYQRIKDNYEITGKPAYMYGAKWANQNRQYYLERINAYIYGIDSKLMPNLKYRDNNNYLMKYKDRKFLESYDEIRTDGQIYVDEILNEEIVLRPANTKVIITYKLK